MLTVGTYGADTQPTVTIKGVTLRGGRASNSPYSEDWVGSPGVFATGAGLEIPAAGDGPGATVTVVDSVITKNYAAPARSLLPSPEQEEFWPRCPDGFCTFAGAWGGGIENWGSLTLLRTTVSANEVAGALTSDADGGGIYSWGDLTLKASHVDGNRAVAVAPHGRYSEGAGIFMADATTLTVHGSTVNSNTTRLTSDIPVTNPDGSVTDMLANAGGIHVNDGSEVVIDSSRIDRNLLVAENPQGRAGAINAGLQLTISNLTLTDSSVSNNRTVTRNHDARDYGVWGGALQVCNVDHISGLKAVGNSTVTTSLAGDAMSSAAIFAGAIGCNEGVDPGPSTLERSVIQGNTTTAIAPRGRAVVFGGGIITGANLTLDRVRVSGNTAAGRGRDGSTVQGGGIWNGMFPFDFLEGMTSRLIITGSTITGNRATGTGPHRELSGGGIYTRYPVAITASVVAGNRPDQCAGCAPTAKADATTGASPGLAQRAMVAASARPMTDPLVARLSHPAQG